MGDIIKLLLHHLLFMSKIQEKVVSTQMCSILQKKEDI